MEDENGLELSLGLGCGGSSSKSKGRSGGPLDIRAEEGDKSTKLVDDFKNFLHGSPQKDSGTGSQTSGPIKPQENFFSDLSKASASPDTSQNLNNRGMWSLGGNRHIETEEEKNSELGGKRKMLFDEMNNQKKHERDANHSALQDKKTSHISMTTEEGSAAENEDVAESEVEGSSSQLASHRGDSSKRLIGVGSPSEAPKDVRGLPDSRFVDLQGPKKPSGLSETEVNHGNLNYGVPFSVRPVNIMNMPYPFPITESKSIVAPSTSGHPIAGVVQAMPTSNGEQRTGAQSVHPNLPAMFGYSPVQLPTLDKDNSWGLVSHLQQFHPSYATQGALNSDKPNDSLKISPAMQSEATLYDRRASERAKVDEKQHITEEGSSSHADDDIKGSNINLRAKDASGPSTAEGTSFDFSAIKPGIASDVKFGGCGSYPNLPWVSTTGSGPNGRTISGVTYRYSANQIRIVCACHGSHMSPEEFVRHANEENVNPGNGSNVASFPSDNPAASAQS